MMSRGVKIGVNMSPNDSIHTASHATARDALKNHEDCSRDLWARGVISRWAGHWTGACLYLPDSPMAPGYRAPGRCI